MTLSVEEQSLTVEQQRLLRNFADLAGRCVELVLRELEWRGTPASPGIVRGLKDRGGRALAAAVKRYPGKAGVFREYATWTVIGELQRCLVETGVELGDHPGACLELGQAKPAGVRSAVATDSDPGERSLIPRPALHGGPAQAAVSNGKAMGLLTETIAAMASRAKPEWLVAYAGCMMIIRRGGLGAALVPVCALGAMIAQEPEARPLLRALPHWYEQCRRGELGRLL